MQTYDISLPLHTGTIVYEGDPRFAIEPVFTIETDGFAVSKLSMGSHTGTHLDAPAHFIPGGLTVDQVPIEILCGPARVLDVAGAGLEIDSKALALFDWQNIHRVLFKTASGPLLDGPFTRQYAHLTPDGASFLRDRTRVRMIGIDTVSIEGEPCTGFPVHHVLLEASPPILLLECIDLRGVTAGDYELVCLPLKIRGGDAAPTRAFLRTAEDVSG
jgi:arylformamidase